MLPDAQGRRGRPRCPAGRGHRADVLRHRRDGGRRHAGNPDAGTRRPTRRRRRRHHPPRPRRCSPGSRSARTLCRVGSRPMPRRGPRSPTTQVRSVNSLYCVVSSADENLGCFIDEASAEERQRSDRAAAPARCDRADGPARRAPRDRRSSPRTTRLRDHAGHLPDRRGASSTEACSFSALQDQEVVYEDEAGNRYRLAPAVIAGRRHRGSQRHPRRGDGLGMDGVVPAHRRRHRIGSPTPPPPRSRCRHRRTRSRSSSTASSSRRRSCRAPSRAAPG